MMEEGTCTLKTSSLLSLKSSSWVQRVKSGIEDRDGNKLGEKLIVIGNYCLMNVWSSTGSRLIKCVVAGYARAMSGVLLIVFSHRSRSPVQIFM